MFAVPGGRLAWPRTWPYRSAIVRGGGHAALCFVRGRPLPTSLPARALGCARYCDRCNLVPGGRALKRRARVCLGFTKAPALHNHSYPTRNPASVSIIITTTTTAITTTTTATATATATDAARSTTTIVVACEYGAGAGAGSAIMLVVLVLVLVLVSVLVLVLLVLVLECRSLCVRRGADGM